MTNAVRGLDQKAATLDALIRPAQRDRQEATDKLAAIATTQHDLLLRLGQLQTLLQNQHAQHKRIAVDLRVIRWLILLTALFTMAVPTILLVTMR